MEDPPTWKAWWPSFPDRLLERWLADPLLTHELPEGRIRQLAQQASEVLQACAREIVDAQQGFDRPPPHQCGFYGGSGRYCRLPPNHPGTHEPT